MNYTIACECGNSIVVRASDAGSQRRCSCGEILDVPSLTTLRQSCQKDSLDDSLDEDTNKNGDGTALVFGVALVVAVVTALASPILLIPLGYCMVLIGRFWFSIRIFSAMSIPNAMMVFFIPFMPTVFLFKRFDIAWKPFFFGIAGIILVALGAAAVQGP